MRCFVVFALLAPTSALACAMPPRHEKELARLMVEIDNAAAPAPEVVAAPAPPAAPDPAAPAAPAAPAPVTIPEAAPPTPAS